MQKTPDEIKRGIITCMEINMEHFIPGATQKSLADALALIQQLEAQNAELLEEIERLQAERDAAVKDIRLLITLYVGGCRTCKHGKHQVDCDEPVLCRMCNVKDCRCRTCDENYSNWEWRGVQKEETP